MKYFKFIIPTLLLVAIIGIGFLWLNGNELKNNVSKVTQGMTYTEVVKLLGDKGTDIGSGMIIYEWEIDEDEKVLVWFIKETSEDGKEELIVSEVEFRSMDSEDIVWLAVDSFEDIN